jgi:hypothetical protein
MGLDNRPRRGYRVDEVTPEVLKMPCRGIPIPPASSEERRRNKIIIFHPKTIDESEKRGELWKRIL